MEDPRLIVATVVWNHRDRLPLLLRSLDDQTHRPDQTVLVDAASHDGVSAWLAQAYPYVSTLRLFQHHGLGHIWRQAAKFALQRVPAAERACSWVLFVSPETLLAKDVCARLLAEAVGHPEVGAFGPAVLRAWYLGEGDDGLEQIEPTELVDAVGMGLTKAFSWQPQGAGGSLRQYDAASTEVFSLSATAAMYRADHLARLLELEALSFPWRTVDALFFDLGWRLHWLGVEARVLPAALAWRVERKGDETGVTTWAERLDRDRDRRRLIYLHLLGIGTRLRTLPARLWAAVRSWPYHAWAVLARRSDAKTDAATGVWKVGRRARDRQREQAVAVLRAWIGRQPLTVAQKPVESRPDSSA